MYRQVSHRKDKFYSGRDIDYWVLNSRLGAIMSTKDISDSLVVRMNSPAAALRRWRYELTLGNQILCLGVDIEEKVSSQSHAPSNGKLTIS